MKQTIHASPMPTDDDVRVINAVKNAFRLQLANETSMERILDLHLMTIQWLITAVVAQGVRHDRLERVVNTGAEDGQRLQAVVQSLGATKQ